MTTIYRTYSPQGDIDHATPSLCHEWITDNDEGVYRTATLEYAGDVVWNDNETLATGKLEWAEDDTKTTATMLKAVWCGDDTMLDENPHELVYSHFNVDQMRAERLEEIVEMRGRPSCGGM